LFNPVVSSVPRFPLYIKHVFSLQKWRTYITQTHRRFSTKLVSREIVNVKHVYNKFPKRRQANVLEIESFTKSQKVILVVTCTLIGSIMFLSETNVNIDFAYIWKIKIFLFFFVNWELQWNDKQFQMTA